MVNELSELGEIVAVTAIGDSVDEDFIAQLIDSQGWQICYRAVDQVDLMDFVSHLDPHQRLIVLMRSDFYGLDIQAILTHISEQVQIISLDEIAVTSHLVMSHLRAQLRQPTFTWRSVLSSEDRPETNGVPVMRSHLPVIAISGTAGSPGKSRLAIALAQRFLSAHKVELWDLDASSQSLAYLWEQSNVSDLIDQAPIRTIPAGCDYAALEFPSDALHILDLGTFPELTHLAHDRRWRPHLINHLLDLSDHLIYVVASSGLHLLRLEEFIEHFPKQLRSIPITYLLAPLNNSREDRAIQERFLALTEGERAVVLAPEESRGRAQSMAQLLSLIDECD
jgi:hypothetical protein